MYVTAFIKHVNKRLKPFFLEQHINIVNRSRFKAFGLSLVDIVQSITGVIKIVTFKGGHVML